MKAEYIEKIYAGWLAKAIGVRLGAPIENWTYERIANVYGEMEGYPVDFREFAADDDTNGPIFFVRALEDAGHGKDTCAQDVADALLNYAPFEHGFFWWGGYGPSTEHTAYLNLRSGIPAPRSGSIAQNGYATAEQIGGQIFVDSWGLVCPGNPDLAAKLAGEAASVTHDGNGIYGGRYVAACIAAAFDEPDVRSIMEKGLSYMPEDCEYAHVVRSVMAYHDEHPDDWRACFLWLRENFGYQLYPGHCHIIPNAGVMALSMLYGEGDFSRTLLIGNMCGWDTDCNVGNVATIMGVAKGLEAIDYLRWRKPINDFLACSSVVGSLNIQDIPQGAAYLVKLAHELAGEELPEPWASCTGRGDACHFEFPGSTHACMIRAESFDARRPADKRELSLRNTDEAAHTGKRSLEVCAEHMRPGEAVLVYRRTYMQPTDFHDTRYDPSFSPLAYPGQVVRVSASLNEASTGALASIYVRDKRTGEMFEGERVQLAVGEWTDLAFTIPNWPGALVGEVGVQFILLGEGSSKVLAGYIDDLAIEGSPCYELDFANEAEEVWTSVHREISQLTKLKGLMFLEDGALNLACSDFAEAYTGHYTWGDYEATFSMTPHVGSRHLALVRVQGGIRTYAVALVPEGVAILKNERGGYRELACVAYPWQTGSTYEVAVRCEGNRICARVHGADVPEDAALEFVDADAPYLTGGVGFGVQKGSRCSWQKVTVRGL